MSLASKAVFTLSCITSVSIITYVHYKQIDDRDKLHLGVVRDQERQARRQRENQYLLTQQAALTEELRRAEKKEAIN